MREGTCAAASSEPIDAAGFREAMSTVVAPVTIVTARDRSGKPFGFTASAVVSLSLDPPLDFRRLSPTH